MKSIAICLVLMLGKECARNEYEFIGQHFDEVCNESV
jgi:hypothetical protein